MINLDMQYIKTYYTPQNNNPIMPCNELSLTRSARFNMSSTPSLSESAIDAIIKYTDDCSKSLFERLSKAEEANVVPYITDPTKDTITSTQFLYNKDVDFSKIVTYIDETTDKQPHNRR
jgi:hypothetical protein